MNNNNIGIKYKELINKEELVKIEEDYLVVSTQKIENNEYSKRFLEEITEQLERHFFIDELINCPYYDGITIDNLILIPKKKGCDNYANA